MTESQGRGGRDDAAQRRLLFAQRDLARLEASLREANAGAAAREGDMAREMAVMAASAETLGRQVRELRHTLDGVYQSNSWRWSLPLRMAMVLKDRLSAALGGRAAQALPRPVTAAAPPLPAAPAEPDLTPRESAILQRLQRPG